MTLLKVAEVSEYLEEKGISHTIQIGVHEKLSPRVYRRIEVSMFSLTQQRVLDLALGLKGMGCELSFSTLGVCVEEES